VAAAGLDDVVWLPGKRDDVAEILNDPHVQAVRLVRDMRLPNGKKTKTVAFPMKISGYEFEVYRDPPELGAHNEEVFAEWLGGGR